MRSYQHLQQARHTPSFAAWTAKNYCGRPLRQPTGPDTSAKMSAAITWLSGARAAA